MAIHLSIAQKRYFPLPLFKLQSTSLSSSEAYWSHKNGSSGIPSSIFSSDLDITSLTMISLSSFSKHKQIEIVFNAVLYCADVYCWVVSIGTFSEKLPSGGEWRGFHHRRQLYILTQNMCVFECVAHPRWTCRSVFLRWLVQNLLDPRIRRVYGLRSTHETVVGCLKLRREFENMAESNILMVSWTCGVFCMVTVPLVQVLIILKGPYVRASNLLGFGSISKTSLFIW